jgi:glycolate oxidase iron-sulfur subunit
MYDFSQTSDACIKCGKCKPTCTIFDITHDESQSPRGFIDLLGAYHRNDLKLDKNAKNIFESCFLCTNCVDVCPIDLPVDTIIEQVRFDIGKKYGIAWYKRAFFWLLRHRKIMDFMAKMGYVFQSCAIKIQSQREFSTLRFSLPIIKKGRALPFAKSTSFLNTYPENIPAKTPQETPQRVAIFIGCMANYTYLDTGKSLVDILKFLNIDIFIPKKQLCCSAPAYFTGDFDTVNYLSTHNIEYFESFIDEVDAIIIPEATCTAMIKEDWERFFYDNIEYKNRAKKLSKKIFMATEWITDNTNIQEVLKNKKNLDDLITYHDPCHAKKVLGIHTQPRDLISKNYIIKEMSDSDVCCGFGGVTMQTDNYHLAKKAGKTKADIITATNADIVSAECSACRMQITNSLYQEKSDIDFKHPLELINKALNEK